VVAVVVTVATIARDKKFKSDRQDLIVAMCLHEQYHSPACWKTTLEAFRAYNKLTTKADGLKKVKEQILMRYLGLGWDDAHLKEQWTIYSWRATGASYNDCHPIEI